MVLEIGMVLLGGLGGFLLWKMAGLAQNSPKTAPGQHRDKLAELERAIQTYRAEVTDLAELVERRHRRLVKREEREKPAEISTGIPQGESDPDPKQQIRAMIMRNRQGAR